MLCFSIINFSNSLGCLNGCYAFAYTTNTVLCLPLISKKSVYINGLLMGHTTIVDFILKRGLIGAKLPNGLCRVLLVCVNRFPLSTLIFFKLKSYAYFGWLWLCVSIIKKNNNNFTEAIASAASMNATPLPI